MHEHLLSMQVPKSWAMRLKKIGVELRLPRPLYRLAVFGRTTSSARHLQAISKAVCIAHDHIEIRRM